MFLETLPLCHGSAAAQRFEEADVDSTNSGLGFRDVDVAGP